MTAQYRSNPNMNVHQFNDDDSYDSRYDRGGGGQNTTFHQSASTRIHPLPVVGESHKKAVDFDSFSSDAEKLSAILKCADVEQYKHTLSVDYFRFRKYVVLVPIVIMCLSIAIGGFVAASDIMKDSMRVHDSTAQDFLTILVATFGFLVLLLTILGNGLDYTSKIAFHRAATEDLTGLCDKIRLYRMERAIDEHAKEEDEELKDLFQDEDDNSSTESDDSIDDHMDDTTPRAEHALIPHTGNALMVKQQMRQNKKRQKHTERLTKTLVTQKVRQAREEQDLSKDVITFYGYHTELHQITVGCRSDVPATISKFFHVMENRVELMSLSRLGVEEESRMRKNQIVRLCANEIYNEISNYWAWPLFTPNVDRTIEGALKRVGQLLNMNYRGQRRCKLLPCCSIPLCCKKKTTNNVFAIINEGIDQRELDMMQAERMELVRMENDRRARRMAGPEEVLEMGQAGRGQGNTRSARSREPTGHRGTAASQNLQSGLFSLDERSRQSRQTRRSRDPDAESYNDMATEADMNTEGGTNTEADMNTEASYSFRGSPGGYASRHYPPNSNGGGRGTAGGLYPQDRSILTEDDDEGMMTEEDETYNGEDVSYMSYTDGEDEETGTAGKKKKKKKKKSKKKKKKKSKSKSKKVEEEAEESTHAGESYAEYSDHSEGGLTNEDDYSEYSEEE
eukprot:CAMPEP_0202003614 /NCGR_PEP_ID=MMETSP0905-20130828/9151_1 /ASSEMBLY_ACC=CAM_ASM_000554 /TAXON_ID=420261 /ORGANISM="Thalassiosira antarctica, Strain CCMP982" /LENGTH=678 /DNA_ID=CAMNT_0048560783 /DNA_START=133 /DNA_END=2169 /DNA_ORIENTATION=-